jgi:hypothetical protein
VLVLSFTASILAPFCGFFLEGAVTDLTAKIEFTPIKKLQGFQVFCEGLFEVLVEVVALEVVPRSEVLRTNLTPQRALLERLCPIGLFF